MLRVTMGFDFVCPWCLIGLRNLRAALAALRAESPHVTVEITWQGVQLLPGVPAAGYPFHEFYLRRLGGEAGLRQRQAQVREAVQLAGARIEYAAIHTMPNTADAHRLFKLAGESGNSAQRDALLESLMTGYFERGDDLGNPAILLAHAVAQGYNPQTLAPALRGAAWSFDSHSGGAGGVPYYHFGGTAYLGGALPALALLEAMRAALAAQQEAAAP